jgi:CreA protein
MKQLLMNSFLVFLSMTFCFSFVMAEEMGSSKTSGFVFKDTLTVHAEDDTDFKNVVCYTTDIEIGGPNLENPSSSSISCRLIGPFKGKPSSKKNVFSRAKNPFFKKLVVDRFYDKNRNVLIYLSYTKKMSGTNSSHSVSVVPLSK